MAGRCHQGLDWAQLVADGGDRLVDLRSIGDVGGQRESDIVGGSQIHACDGPPALGQFGGHGGADAGGRARHRRHLRGH